VPQTRSKIGREQKVAEILDAAETRLRDGDLEALSVAGIARELDLSPNAVYWYFPSKDQLVIATVRRMLEDTFSRKPPARWGIERQIRWFVEQLEELDPLRIALHERARRSKAVEQFVEELRESSNELLTNALRGQVCEEDLDTAAEALLATIDGVALRRLGPEDRRRVISYAVSHLTGTEKTSKETK
jgi:AcrR family transcriptional regulator